MAAKDCLYILVQLTDKSSLDNPQRPGNVYNKLQVPTNPMHGLHHSLAQVYTFSLESVDVWFVYTLLVTVNVCSNIVKKYRDHEKGNSTALGRGGQPDQAARMCWTVRLPLRLLFPAGVALCVGAVSWQSDMIFTDDW